jgi:PAS domain S-box-containing protein
MADSLEDLLARDDLPEDAKEALRRHIQRDAEERTELERTRALLDRLLRSADVWRWEIDYQTWESVGSDAWLQQMGYEPGEIDITDFTTFFDYVHPDDIGDVMRVMKESLERPGEPFRYTFRWPRKDGGWSCWVSSGAFISDPSDPDAGRTYGINVDITELYETQQALERANQELREFLSMVSHDLKAPMAAVTAGLSELCAEAGDSERLQVALRAATRARGMIDDIMEYAQLGRTPARPEWVPLARVVETATEDLAAAIGESGATLTADGLPEVWADPTLLERVLQNLLANALKFRRPEPPEIRVGAEWNARESCHTVTVADNGRGIEEWNLAKLFTPFYRAHADSDVPGTGIGLAICRRIVGAHGGEITASSEPGRGSTFRFTLPGPAREP